MSYISSEGLIVDSNGNYNVGYAFNIAIATPVSTASGASFTVVPNAVIPKGTWLINGWVGVSCINTETIAEVLTGVNRNGTLIQSVRSSGGYYLDTAILQGIPFYSDGTTTFSFTITAGTSNAVNYITDAGGSGSGISFVKLLN
jgi:hypothetical protein